MSKTQLKGFLQMLMSKRNLMEETDAYSREDDHDLILERIQDEIDNIRIVLELNQKYIIFNLKGRKTLIEVK